MSWVVTLKAPPTPIKILGEVFRQAPEIWKKAKKINHTFWDLLNSYMLHLIKTYPDKSIDWYIEKAEEWLKDKEDVGKSFDFKVLPGININSWSMLLETLNPATVKVAYNKLLEEGVKFSRYRDTQSFLERTRENGRQVARKVIGQGAREQRDRMQSIASNFDEILPTLKKILETQEENKRGIAVERSDNREQLIGAFIDILGEIKLDVEIDWKDLELRVRKYFSGRRKSRQEKKQFIIDLKRKSNPDALKTLKEKIPEDAPALQDLFKDILAVQHSSQFEVVEVNPRIAYDYIMKINQEKRLHGKNIRELHLQELKDLAHVTKNKRWMNNLLKTILLDVGSPMEQIFKEVYEDKALRKDLFLDNYMKEAWEEYDTGTVEEGGEKLDEIDWKKNFKQQLTTAGNNDEKEGWKEFFESKRKAIRTIKSGVPPLFVKFMGELAHALQADDKGPEHKQLSDAFLEVYSPEEANTFSSNYLKQEGGGFGYQKRVSSPRIRESEEEKTQYAGRTLPQTPADYASIVKEIHDILLGDLSKEGDEDLDDLWQDLADSDTGRVQTKEYHLAGVSDEDAKTEFDAKLKDFTKPLEKAIAIEVYDAYVNGERLTGSQGIFTSNPKVKMIGADLHLHTWVNFLRFAQNKIVKETKDIQNKLQDLDSEMNKGNKTYAVKLREIKTSSPPLFDNEITNLAQALESSISEVQTKLVDLVRQKLEDIKDTPELYISRTFSGLMGELEDKGFIRRVGE